LTLPHPVLALPSASPYSRDQNRIGEDTVPSEIERLIELQRIDQQLTDAARQTDHLQATRDALLARIASQRATVQANQQELTGLRHDSRLQNLAVDELDDRIRAYQKRLDEGIISFKEMEDLQAKIESERTRINRMEDEALELMDRIESTQVAAEGHASAAEQHEAALREQIAGVDDQMLDVRSKVDALQAERAQLTESIPSYLRSQYDGLHRKFEDPVAEIHHGTCSGCKLKLSGNTVERARGALGIVTCEHCSRILRVS